MRDVFKASFFIFLMSYATVTASSPAMAENLYGFIIGIDDYLGTQNDLEGAVNDANDLSTALTKAGAKNIVRFTNTQAVKNTIEKAWYDLVNEAQSGDTIVFTFSGHGSQEKEPAGRGGEADGQNENFLLAGFNPNGAGSEQRIIDDEIFVWMKAADDKGIKVILVADSCHSGTMNRDISNRRMRYRKMRSSPISDDRLVFPGQAAAKLTEDDLKLATFVGATTDDRLTPEVHIDNKIRGALSWSVARAIEGVADKNKDGAVSQVELLSYIIPTVKSHVENQQNPQIAPLRAGAFRLFSVNGGSGGSGSVATLLQSGQQSSGDNQALKIFIDGDGTSVLKGLNNVAIAADPSEADLIWYPAKQTIEHSVGGVVAQNVDDANIRFIVAKWASIKWLKGQMSLSPVSVRLPRGDQRYQIGDIVEVEITDVRYPYLTLFNMPPDGKVEFLLPTANKPEEAQRVWDGTAYKQKFKVSQPPYGAEHLVAIYSDEVLSGLHAALATMGQPKNAAALRDVLKETLEGKKYQVGVLSIYTGE